MKVVLNKEALEPTRAHKDDAGLDLYSPISCIVKAKDSVVIDTGVHVELPKGTAGFLKSKSGLNINYGITSDGVVDVGYTGSIKVKLYNHSSKDYAIVRGDKITQLVVVKIETPKLEITEELEETERGDNGFGSTGK